MSLFIELPTGHKLFAEFAGWSSTPARFDVRREDGELILWIGRLNLIYTPRTWKPVRSAYGGHVNAHIYHTTGPGP